MGRPKGVQLDGVLIRARRVELGLTQAEVAELARLTRRTVASAERGKRISVYSARQLSAAIGLPYAGLLRLSPAELERRLVERGLAPPPPPSPWAGRHGEVERIMAAFESGGSRLRVAVAGRSGIGKTGLAQRVAAALRTRFPDGVVWVSASAIKRPAELLSLQLDIADTLEIRALMPNPSVTDPAALDRAFRTQLWRRRRLLIVDDVSDEAVLRRLVGDEAPQWVLITTSRREVARRLGGVLVELGPLSPSASRELLEAHVGADRLAADSEATDQLVAALSGVPRSLQIAGRVLATERYTRVADYLTRLHSPTADDGARLPWGAPNDPDSSFVSAYAQLQDRLPETTWRVFADLAIFEERTFPLSWAIAVTGLSPAAGRQCLSQLSDHFLLREVNPSSGTIEPRFQLDAQALRAARWMAHEHDSSAQVRLLGFATQEAGRIAAVAASEQPHDVTRNLPLWRFCLDTLSREVLGATASAVAEPEALDALAESLPDDRRRIGRLPRLLLDLRAAFRLDTLAEAGPWLTAGLGVAKRLGDDLSVAQLAEVLAFWWAGVRGDFGASRRWLLLARDALQRERRWDDAARLAVYLAEAAYASLDPEGAVADMEKALAIVGREEVSLARRAAVTNNLAACLTQVPWRPQWLARAESLLEEALRLTAPDSTGRAETPESPEGDGSVIAMVRAVTRLNLAVVRRARGRELGGDELPDALGRLRALLTDDGLSLFVLDELAVFLGLVDHRPRRSDEAMARERRRTLLSVPSELVGRRLIDLYQIAVAALADPEVAPGAPPGPRRGVATRAGRIDLRDILLGLPIEDQLGHGLALLFPIDPAVALLEGPGLGDAMQFVGHLVAPEHPTAQALRELATRSEPSKPG